MTGTGTQNDPYIVDNTADFLEAVEQSDVYVQLVSDIDAAADGYEYIGTVTVNALSLNGNGFAIRNATFQPGNNDVCFSAVNVNSVWQDISFLDCSVKPSGTSAWFIAGNNNSFSGMKLSIQVQPLSNFTLFNVANVSNCAADITMNGGSIIILHYANSLSNSTFFIRGSYSFGHAIQGNSGAYAIQAKNVGIVFDGYLPSGTTCYIGNYVTFVGCYFAIADSATIPGGQGLSISLGQYSTGGQNVVFSVGSGVSDSVTTPSAYPRLTTAQMKDAAYLQSIGWLP